MRDHVGPASSPRRSLPKSAVHLDDLFDDSLWDMLLARELRLRTNVFAGAIIVTLSSSECSFTKSFRERVSENSDWFSLDSPSSNTWSSFRSSSDFSVNHLGVILFLVLSLELMLNAASCPSGFPCISSCSLRAVYVVSSLHCFATGTSTVVSMY